MIFDLTIFQSSDFLIPFLFVLAIVFGVLELSNVFKNRAVNFIVALSLSLFTVSNSAFINLLWSYFGSISVFFIAMFFIAFVFEIFGVRKKGQPVGGDSILVNGAVLFVLLSIGYLYIDMVPSIPFVGGGENLLLLFAVIFILAVFWAAYKVGATEPARK